MHFRSPLARSNPRGAAEVARRYGHLHVVVAEALTTLALAAALDRLGEPPNVIHPVVGIGWLIKWQTQRAPTSPPAQLLCGVQIVLVAACVAAGSAALIERGLRPWPLVRIVVVAVLLQTTFAHRALVDAALAVCRPLARGDLAVARFELRALVSRDRASLDAGQIAAAAIESLGENLSDSVVAPLLAYAVGGLPAAMAYRAVNTADAMIGYRGQYEYLGKAAAQLDDLLNVVPARLTAALVALGAGDRRSQAWKVAMRNHHLTASPNAGWPMSAMAGALDVTLEKLDHYQLNATARTPTAADLKRSIALARWPSWLALGLALTLTGLRVVVTGYLANRDRFS